MLFLALNQWLQCECNFGRDEEGVNEQLQGIRERVPFLLDDNVGPIVSPCEVCAEPAELGLNESSCENHDSCG